MNNDYLRVNSKSDDPEIVDSEFDVEEPKLVPVLHGFLIRVYLKTHDVTGSEGFLRCARHFFAGILTYFKEK